MVTITNDTDREFRDVIRDIATEKQKTQKVVELRINAPSNNETMVLCAWQQYDVEKDYPSFSSADLRTWFYDQEGYNKLKWRLSHDSIYVKGPNFKSEWENSHCGEYVCPELQFSDFENKVYDYFKANDLKLFTFYKHQWSYLRVDQALLINFFKFIGSKEDIIAAWCDVERYIVYFKDCPEDAKAAKEKLYNYAKEFKLLEHFKNVFLKDGEPCDDLAKTLEFTIKPASINPKKKLEEIFKQGVLKDQNNVLIEPGDVIAYPRGGDHNYYCLDYGIVKGNTKDFIVMTNDLKARCNKVMVIKTNNKDKKLPWE